MISITLSLEFNKAVRCLKRHNLTINVIKSYGISWFKESPTIIDESTVYIWHILESIK